MLASATSLHIHLKCNHQWNVRSINKHSLMLQYLCKLHFLKCNNQSNKDQYTSIDIKLLLNKLVHNSSELGTKFLSLFAGNKETISLHHFRWHKTYWYCIVKQNLIALLRVVALLNICLIMFSNFTLISINSR